MQAMVHIGGPLHGQVTFDLDQVSANNYRQIYARTHLGDNSLLLVASGIDNSDIEIYLKEDYIKTKIESVKNHCEK